MKINDKYPLFPWLSVFFILGLYLQDVSPIRSIYLLSASILIIVCTLFAKKFRYKRIMILLSFFLIGMGWASKNQECADKQKGFFTPYIKSKSTVTLTGRVTSFPTTQRNKTKFYLKVHKTDPIIPVSPRLLVYLTGTIEKQPSFADTIEIQATLKNTSRFRLNRFLTYKGYLSFRNVYIIAKTDKVKIISSPFGWLTRLRKKLLDNLRIGIDGTKESQLICAMLFGERPNIDYYIFRQFAVFGIIHILVISGLHIGCIAFIGITLLQLCGLSRKVSLTVMLPIVIFYLFLVGFKVSITRAVLMISFYFCADFFNRERNAIHALIFAGVIQLIFMPNLIYDHGFQYSFMSIMAILFIYPILMAPFKNRILFRIMQYPTLSFSVWIVISPLAAYRNGIFSPIGFILGTVALIFVQVIVLVGIASACAGFLVTFLSEIFNLFNFMMIKTILKTTAILYDTISLQRYFHSIPPIIFLVYYLGITAVIVFLKKTNRKIIGMIILFLSMILAGII